MGVAHRELCSFIQGSGLAVRRPKIVGLNRVWEEVSYGCRLNLAGVGDEGEPCTSPDHRGQLGIVRLTGSDL